MTTSSKAKLVFFGNERLATGVSTSAPVLRALIAAGYEIVCVITTPGHAVSRSARQLEIAEVAKANNIPVLQPAKLKEISGQLSEMKAQTGILVAYGKLVPQEIIDIFPSGIINIHPSLLPKYRGSTPIETAILYDTASTGVSLMALSAEMDTGPIYAQAKLDLNGDETKAELTDKLVKIGVDLLISKLDSILNGKIKPTAQSETGLSFTKQISKADGLVNFTKSAELIERQVRAYAGWPKSPGKVFDEEIVILKARVANDRTDGDLVMQCRPGWLEITELTGPSGKTMSGADFIRGYKK